MLAFFNEHLTPANRLIYDRQTYKCYHLIPKNGSTSLSEMIEKEPDRFVYFGGCDSTEFLREHGISVVTFFLRDPIERFLSGVMQQQRVYRLDINALIVQWELSGTITILDLHTIPQFSFLLRSTKPPGLQINLLPLADLDKICPGVPKTNVSKKKITLDMFSRPLIDKIYHYYTEDIVLYNQFLNKTTEFDRIVDQIRKENDFVKEYQSYYKTLTYL